MSRSRTLHPFVSYSRGEDGVIEKLEHVPNCTYGNVGNGDLRVFVPRESNVDLGMFFEQRMDGGARKKRRRMD